MLLSRAQAAKRAGVCVATLDAVIRRDNSPLRIKKVGRRVLILADSFDAWLAS